MAVSKKTGSAVRRNRVKRVLREFFRLNQTLLPPATDFVVVPKRQLKPENVTLACVSRELLPLLQEVRGRMPLLRPMHDAATDSAHAATAPRLAGGNA